MTTPPDLPLCEHERLIADLRSVAVEHWNDCTGDISREAADTIERLTAELTRLRAEVEHVREICEGWVHFVRDCDDDVGDVVREFSDSIDAALAQPDGVAQGGKGE